MSRKVRLPGTERWQCSVCSRLVTFNDETDRTAEQARRELRAACRHARCLCRPTLTDAAFMHAQREAGRRGGEGAQLASTPLGRYGRRVAA